eukprot:3275834-Rhodomonas_salina.2
MASSRGDRSSHSCALAGVCGPLAAQDQAQSGANEWATESGALPNSSISLGQEEDLVQTSTKPRLPNAHCDPTASLSLGPARTPGAMHWHWHLRVRLTSPHLVSHILIYTGRAKPEPLLPSPGQPSRSRRVTVLGLSAPHPSQRCP